VSELSPTLLTAFITERSRAGLVKSTVRDTCGVLKVFLRYAHRQGVLSRDLSEAVEWPQVYRLSTLPRSITWDEVGRVLAAVDRRTPRGKRDYAILLLLVIYGLRAREISALTLDDIDWKRERLAIPERKAGHSTAFPLSPTVGAALVDYLQHGRPTTDERRVFFRAAAPAATGHRSRGVLLRPGLSPQGRDHGPAAGVPHAAPYLRAATRRRRVRVEDDRRLRGSPIAQVHRDLLEGRRGEPARCRPRRRRGRAPMTAATEPVLAAVVAGFLEHRRALGRKYDSEQAELRLLVRFAEQRGLRRLDELTPGVLDEFVAMRPRTRPRSFNHLIGVVAGLLDWAVTQQLLDTAPPLRQRRRRVTAGQLPFLFDQAQAGRLLAAAGALPDNSRAPRRGQTHRTVFALCYGLGLRAGEACGLRLGDVDTSRQLIVVRGGKFGKTRLVPHGPRIGELLQAQLDYRHASTPTAAADAPLFTFDGRRGMHPGTASQTFHHLVPALDLPVPDGVSPPRLHSLRHSFAVGCLLRWYRDGLDPAARLLQLATFMGHVDPKSTAVYLQITPALLAEANRRFEAFAAPAWTEATP
jgi:integrase